MSEFFRFPHTPHLTWLGRAAPRSDKVLSPAELQQFLDAEVVVEEKIDGANLGFSASPEGKLLVQNRGSYLAPEIAHPQFAPLWPWMRAREEALLDALWPNRVLFGEWCHAVHSVVYDRLPDWFLGFDLYDREAGIFWSSSRRDALLSELGLYGVPRVAAGRFGVPELEGQMGISRVGTAPMEGLIVRRELQAGTEARAKLVRPEFTQAIEEHWSRRPLHRNRLTQGSTA